MRFCRGSERSGIWGINVSEVPDRSGVLNSETEIKMIMSNSRRTGSSSSLSLLYTLGLLGSTAFTLGVSAPEAHAADRLQDVSYRVCIRAQDVSEGGTDGDLYATLEGVNGKTEKMLLDNPDKNDFDRNQWTCVELPALQNGVGDVGPINYLEIFMEGSDDFCYKQQAVERLVKGKRAQISQFPGIGCIGDNTGNATSANIRAETLHTASIGTPKGRWFPQGSGGNASSSTIKKSFTSTDENRKSLSKEEVNSITSTVSSEAEMEGVGKISASVSGTHSLAVTSVNEIVSTQSIGYEETCSTSFDYDSQNYTNVWQWGMKTSIGGAPLTVKTCHFACTIGSAAPSKPLGHPSLARSCNKVTDATRTPITPVLTPAPDTPIRSAENGNKFCLTAHNGVNFVVSEANGQSVNANRKACGPWEKHNFVDINGGDLVSGDYVYVYSHHGKLWSAQPNGTLQANRTAKGPWEKFQIFKKDGGTIRANDSIGLKGAHSKWVVAESGGGKVVKVDRPAQGAWETFKLSTP